MKWSYFFVLGPEFLMNYDFSEDKPSEKLFHYKLDNEQIPNK